MFSAGNYPSSEGEINGGDDMTNNSANDVIEEKKERLERLCEELEICKLVIQDKIKEATQIQAEISLLQNLQLSD
jgi:hypothetical protein